MEAVERLGEHAAFPVGDQIAGRLGVRRGVGHEIPIDQPLGVPVRHHPDVLPEPLFLRAEFHGAVHLIDRESPPVRAADIVEAGGQTGGREESGVVDPQRICGAHFRPECQEHVVQLVIGLRRFQAQLPEPVIPNHQSGCGRAVDGVLVQAAPVSLGGLGAEAFGKIRVFVGISHIVRHVLLDQIVELQNHAGVDHLVHGDAGGQCGHEHIRGVAAGQTKLEGFGGNIGRELPFDPNAGALLPFLPRHVVVKGVLAEVIHDAGIGHIPAEADVGVQGIADRLPFRFLFRRLHGALRSRSLRRRRLRGGRRLLRQHGRLLLNALLRGSLLRRLRRGPAPAAAQQPQNQADRDDD